MITDPLAVHGARHQAAVDQHHIGQGLAHGFTGACGLGAEHTHLELVGRLAGLLVTGPTAVEVELVALLLRGHGGTLLLTLVGHVTLVGHGVALAVLTLAVVRGLHAVAERHVGDAHATRFRWVHHHHMRWWWRSLGRLAHHGLRGWLLLRLMRGLQFGLGDRGRSWLTTGGGLRGDDTSECDKSKEFHRYE